MQITWYQIFQNFQQAKKAAYAGNLATSHMKFLPLSGMKKRLAKKADFGRFLTFLGNFWPPSQLPQRYRLISTGINSYSNPNFFLWQEHMSHSQMLGKVEYVLPAKI